MDQKEKLEKLLNDFLSENNIQERLVDTIDKGFNDFEYRTSDDIRLERLEDRMTLIRRFILVADILDKERNNLKKVLPPASIFERLRCNRLKFGAKAAHLMFFQDAKDHEISLITQENSSRAKVQLNEVRALVAELDTEVGDPCKVLDEISQKCLYYLSGINRLLDFQIPVSIFGSIDLFDRWKGGEEPPAKILKPLYDKVTKKLHEARQTENTLESNLEETENIKIIVRSSAVYSEDGEQATGAGIYHSEKEVPLDSFDLFVEAVIKVWESTLTPEALAYQESLNIEEEKMGLLIQIQFDGFLIEANSQKSHQESLIELNHPKTGSKVLLQKKLLPLDTTSSRRIGSSNKLYSSHTNVDNDSLPMNFRQSRQAILAALVTKLEALLSQAIQAEIINVNGKNILVQVRPLPKIETQEVPEFLNHIPHLFVGRGMGVGSIELNRSEYALGSSSWNTREGPHNFIKPSEVTNYKVVIAINSFSVLSGHVEQQCLEKGVLLVTNDPGNPHVFPESLPENIWVISNGLEARIYDANLVKSIRKQNV